MVRAACRKDDADLKILSFGLDAQRLAFRTVAFVCAAFALASCGDGAGYDDSPDDSEVPAYEIDFYVQTPGKFGALQLDITHLGSSGGFIGREDKVDCVPLVEAIVASNYLGERVVKIGLISLQGIVTPSAVMRCGFRTREELGPSDFEIEVTDASDTESKQIDPPPVVVVSAIVER
jgi:hypothetical protein